MPYPHNIPSLSLWKQLGKQLGKQPTFAEVKWLRESELKHGRVCMSLGLGGSVDIGVSINGGTPKWMVYMGKSNLNR